MLHGDWRDSTLRQIEAVFKDDPDVVSLSLFGSTSKDNVEKDRWSDHDLLLIVKDGSLEKFYPTREWLQPFGEIFGIIQNQDDIHCNVKVIFSDFRKLDFVITTKSKAQHELKFLTRQKIVFSHDEEITRLLFTAPTSHPFTSDFPFDQLVEEFWYWAFVSVSRLARNDLLNAQWLALDLYKKCLELVMWFRDKETGSNFHRFGGVRNELLEEMNITFDSVTGESILSLIGKACLEFDKLAQEWSTEYSPHFPEFKQLLILVQEDVIT